MALKPPGGMLWIAAVLTIMKASIDCATMMQESMAVSSDEKQPHTAQTKNMGLAFYEQKYDVGGDDWHDDSVYGLHKMGPWLEEPTDVPCLGLKWHGTRVTEDESDEGYDSTHAQVQSYALSRWQVLLPDNDVTSTPRRRTRRLSIYDPASTQGMEGHCLYACMFKNLTGQNPGQSAITWVRRRIRAEWKASKSASMIAAHLDMSTQEYATTYLDARGWGGLPELMVYVHAVRKRVYLLDPAGNLIRIIGEEGPIPELWIYDGSHYILAKRTRTEEIWAYQAGQGYDIFQDHMRGGGKQAPHKRKTGKSRERRHGWDADIALPGDTRPPLPRRRRVRSPLPHHQQHGDEDPDAESDVTGLHDPQEARDCDAVQPRMQDPSSLAQVEATSAASGSLNVDLATTSKAPSRVLETDAFKVRLQRMSEAYHPKACPESHGGCHS